MITIFWIYIYIYILKLVILLSDPPFPFKHVIVPPVDLFCR
jgi:hypothetical protein